MAEGMKETIAGLRDSIKEAFGKLVTIYNDRSDAEKRNILIIGGGSLFVIVLFFVLMRILFPPDLQVRVAANTVGVLGENFVAVENREEEPIVDLEITLDEKYIYKQVDTGDEMPVGEVLTVKMTSFSSLRGDQSAPADYVPKIAILNCDLGSVEINFLEQ